MTLQECDRLKISSLFFPRDNTDTRWGRNGAAAPLFAGIDIREVHFNGWQAGIEKCVVQSVAVVRESAGIDDDARGIWGFFLGPINKSTFVVRLERFNVKSGLLCLHRN